MENKTMKAIGMSALVIAAGVAGATAGANLFPKEVKVVNPVNTEMQKQITNFQIDLNTKANTISEALVTIEKLKTEMANDDAVIAENQAQINRLNEQIARDQAIIDEYKQLADEVAVIDNPTGYTMQNVFLNTPMTETLSDRNLVKLQDDEISFNGDKYDIEETLAFNFKVATNEVDFNGKPYVMINQDDIEYKYVIESSLDTSEITEEDTLKINLLGKEVEISDWSSDEVTFTSGKTIDFSAGQTRTIEGKTFVLSGIGNDEAQFTIDGELFVIEEGNTEDFGDLEIYLERATTFIDDTGYAKIKVGTKIKETVKDGDEYKSDDRWEWVITPNSIGIKLVESYTNLDDDYTPLAEGEKLSLPDDFMTINFDGLVEQNYETYSFDTYTKDGSNYLRIRGNFLSGISDYNKIYVDGTGIYDEDLNLIGQSIELADTDSILGISASANSVIVNGIEISLDVTSVTADGNDLVNYEDDYTTDYGITINNPESSIEDNRLKLIVPEEEVEALVRVE